MEVWDKSQTVDVEVRAYIYSLVSAVGGQSTVDDRYAVGDDALAVLSDLVRWLKAYDEKTDRFDVRRCLAEANLVKGDLLEILALWPEEEQDSKLKAKLALKCYELLVPLTWPMEMADEKTTRNHLRHIPYLQLAQVGYKRAILQYEDAKILRTAVRSVLPSMAMPRRERSKRDESIIRLMLYFFRNTVVITQPQDLPSQGDENDISRSATIDAFHEQDVFNFLLTVGSGAGDEFQERDAELLEILFHLLKGIDPKKLFRNESQVQSDETKELMSLMQKEKAMLNQYNKHAPTRHNRFGTMIWVKRGDEKMSTMSGQNSITDAHTTLLQMDSSKQVNKPRQRMKQRWEDLTETQEFGTKVELKESARKHLRSFVEDFLDSSFNPLFRSLRKAIEVGAHRIGSVHPRQFFYVIYWFLSAEAARRETRRQQQTQSEENAFAHIAAVLDQETFVLLTRQMQKLYDDKRWQDLQATLLSFTQILLTVQAMAESPDEEDEEIAENIQNRIFYEESTHDLLVSILRNYKNQGFWYLDAVTECIHVFVRMLERYSKQNADLQIRSKRKARRKKKKEVEAQGTNVDDEDLAAADDQDEYEAQVQVRERKFDFSRFSSKFLAQGCVDTFINLLKFYQDLNADQLKRCHRYLYRLAFKHELGIYLFRVDILQLLHRMIKGPDGLDPASDGFREMEILVQQVFRRCIKWIERENEGKGWREAAVVEMLFSKIPGTTFYLQNGYERVIERRAPRPPAELEIKKNVEEGKRVGIAVSLLLDQGKQDAVEWIKDQSKRAAEERRAWEDGNAAMAEVQRMSGDGEEAQETSAAPASSAPSIFISPDTTERKEALFKDKYLRLLLTTLGIQRLGTAEDTDASWMVPSELTARQLEEAVSQIQSAEFDPPSFDEGQSAHDLIRNRSAGRSGRRFSDTESSDSDGDLDGPMFPKNLPEPRREGEERPKKRKRLTKRDSAELTEEQVEERAKERERKERERNSKIKSELLVVESDDEEEDEEFFRLEEERRKKMAGAIRSQLLKEAREGKIGKKGGKKETKRPVDDSDLDGDEAGPSKKRRAASASEDDPALDEDVDMLSDPDGDLGRPSLRAQRKPVSTAVLIDSSDDSESEDEEFLGTEAREEQTPSTSQPHAEDGPEELPLGEVSGNAANMKNNSVSRPGIKMQEVDGEDDDDDPIVKPVPQRRNVRAGFIVDDDSDDE